MKINVTILAALFFSMPLTSNAIVRDNIAYEAQEDIKPTHFILCLKSGEKVGFLLEKHPKVVNGEGFITVCDDNMSIEYPWEDIHKYTIDVDDTHTSINNINGEDDMPEGSISNQIGLITLSGFSASEPVIISNINGAVVYKSQTDNLGSLNISTSNFATGIYIVKVKNQTFKFIKR